MRRHDRQLREAERRREARQRGLGQLKYHAGLLAEGYGTDHDRDKVQEAVERQVTEGTPPSSLDLRNWLLPARPYLRAPRDPEARTVACSRSWMSISHERRPAGTARS